jgi:alkanesulfonate monooxygenase SsuD/methylene tetrahydromethanopterin reductase-like flavin-dependent oxidoreductase (luciferase family)
MDIGASIFFTEYSISPTELGMALEERGFDSLWVAEHSHIPVTRRFGPPGGSMELTKQYHDVMDPFVTLSAAAAGTTRLKLATGVCLVIQRDTIQTAKLVASLDQVSKGRFLFGIGCGWNAEEMEDAASSAQFGMGMGRAQDCGVERTARSRQIVGEAAAAEQQVGVFQARQNGRSPLTVTRCMTRRWPW